MTGEGETPALGGAAIEGYNTSLVGVTDADSVDVTSGATVTSTAVKEAFAAALAQAKGEAVANDAAIAFKAGTYTASAKGYNGDVTVSVTFSDDAVTAIEVTDSSETAHVGDVAFEPMIADMLAAERFRRGQRFRRDLLQRRAAQRRERRGGAGRVRQPWRVQGEHR